MEAKFRELILSVFRTEECSERIPSDWRRRMALIDFCQKHDPTKPLGYYGDKAFFIDEIQAKHIKELYNSI